MFLYQYLLPCTAAKDEFLSALTTDVIVAECIMVFVIMTFFNQFRDHDALLEF
jgi:hypothetical protein